MKKGDVRFRGGIVFLIFISAVFINYPVFAGDVDILPPNVSYQDVENNNGAYGEADYNPDYGWGVAEISSPSYPDYGDIGIEYHYWKDQTYGYWYYSYKILNDGTGPGDAYHFGWDIDNDSKNGNKIFDEVDEFAIMLDFYQDGSGYWHGPDDLYVTGDGTSTAGGDPWGHQTWSQYNHEMEWSTTRSSGTAYGLEPSRWYQQGQSTIFTNGDTTTDDGGGYDYFQLVSSWGPDWVEAQAVAGSAVAYSQNFTEGGDGVMGPAEIPEPATFLLFGLGVLGIKLYKRRR